MNRQVLSENAQIDNPKLCIGILTYNHEKFIAKALNGIFKQRVDFPYQVVISDDASSDKTPTILKQFKQQYPDKIQLFLHKNNQGVFDNAMHTLQACKGEYLIIMDGDDEWLFEKKIQEQVDFLDANPDFAGCFHDALIKTENSQNSKTKGYFSDFKTYSQFNKYNSDYYPWDMIERNIIPTSSLVFRRECLGDEIKNFHFVKYSLVWIYHLLIIKQSKFRYFNETWSLYNNHGDSLTKKVKGCQFIKTNIKILHKLLNDDYYQYFKHHIYKSLSQEYTYLFYLPQSGLTSTERRKLIWKVFFTNIQSAWYNIRSMKEAEKKRR